MDWTPCCEITKELTGLKFTLAGSSPLQSLPVVGHSCPEEKELLSSDDSSTSSKGLPENEEEDSSSGLERLDSPVEWNRCRHGSSGRRTWGAWNIFLWVWDLGVVHLHEPEHFCCVWEKLPSFFPRLVDIPLPESETSSCGQLWSRPEGKKVCLCRASGWQAHRHSTMKTWFCTSASFFPIWQNI